MASFKETGIKMDTEKQEIATLYFSIVFFLVKEMALTLPIMQHSQFLFALKFANILQLKSQLNQVKSHHHNKFEAGPTKGFTRTLFASSPQKIGNINETPLLFPWQEFPTYEEIDKK